MNDQHPLARARRVRFGSHLAISGLFVIAASTMVWVAMDSGDGNEPLNLENITFTSYAALDAMPSDPTAQQKTARFTHTYHTWSDVQIVAAYETLWEEAQQIKLSFDGRALDAEARAPFDDRMAALWDQIQLRELAAPRNVPEPRIVGAFLATDTEAFLQAWAR